MIRKMANWLPDYEWKPIAEVVWIGFVAALIYISSAIVAWNTDDLTQWRVILPSLFGGAGRAALGAMAPKLKTLLMKLVS